MHKPERFLSGTIGIENIPINKEEAIALAEEKCKKEDWQLWTPHVSAKLHHGTYWKIKPSGDQRYGIHFSVNVKTGKVVCIRIEQGPDGNLLPALPDRRRDIHSAVIRAKINVWRYRRRIISAMFGASSKDRFLIGEEEAISLAKAKCKDVGWEWNPDFSVGQEEHIYWEIHPRAKGNYRHFIVDARTGKTTWRPGRGGLR